MENLACELKKITDNWEICAITDGASNIKGAIRQLHWNNFFCFAHRLNLVITCALKEDSRAKEVIEGIKAIVSFFHRSSLTSAKLQEIQARLDLPDHKLV